MDNLDSLVVCIVTAVDKTGGLYIVEFILQEYRWLYIIVSC